MKIDFSHTEIECAIEAILFSAGEFVSIEKLSETLDIDKKSLLLCLEKMENYYNFNKRGIILLKADEKVRFASRADYSKQVCDTLGIRKKAKLSTSCMETLSIIAYKQPVTRAIMEQIRSVDCSYALGVLLDRGLIERAGKLDVPGKPTLYKTNDKFLMSFGIKSLKELPELPEIFEIDKISEKEEITKIEQTTETEQTLETEQPPKIGDI